MTRENKLALVVGFALILLVGIAISDHFSPAQNQESASLTGAVDTLPRDGALTRRDLMAAEPSRAGTRLVEPPRPEPNIVGFPPGHVGETPPPRHDAAHRDAARHETSRDDDATAPASRGIEIGAPIHRPETPPTPANETTVTVKPNQTLTHICRDHYRDTSLIDALAAYNGISDPGRIRAGATIRLPERRALTGAPAPSSTSETAAPSTPTYRTHTVRANENLSAIAKRYLRAERRYLEIYELNRDVLDDPNSVREGMVLKIPTS